MKNTGSHYAILLLLSIFICESNAQFNEPNFNVFQTFKDAATSFLESIFTNVPVIARTLKDTIGAAIEEECVFKCPNGKKPAPNYGHVAEGNGCGVPGLKIPSYVSVSQLEECCNEHDICYGTCNRSKEKCDANFKECLYKVCYSVKKYVPEDLLKGCKMIAKTLYTAVTAVGCKFYLDSQRQACLCYGDYYHDYPPRDEI